MNTKTWIRGCALALSLLAWMGCATHQVKLEMEREIVPNHSAVQIREIRVDPSGRLNTWDQPRTITVTMKGDAELEATFDLTGRLEGRPMQETEPGVYTGDFEVRANETGTVNLVGHLMHSPTGARREIRSDEALILFTEAPPTQPSGCPEATAAQYEEELKTLTVTFEFDKFDVTPDARQILSGGKDLLLSNAACALHLHGHADEIGTPEYNMALSSRRAGAVAEFIQQELGLPADRIARHWYGESRPVDRTGTPEGMARNRRVEFHAVHVE